MVNPVYRAMNPFEGILHHRRPTTMIGDATVIIVFESFPQVAFRLSPARKSETIDISEHL